MATKDPDQPSARKAEVLVEKVQRFVETLDPEERELFAVLIGPGVQSLWDVDEVSGFGAEPAPWTPGSLRAGLAEALQNSGLTIVTKD
jgi:hypothetical protein